MALNILKCNHRMTVGFKGLKINHLHVSTAPRYYTASLTLAATGVSYRTKPPKLLLSPTVKHTGRDSGGKLCGIFKFL